MQEHDRLLITLQRIDGRPYPAYRDLRGRWALNGLTIFVDHVQGDPFAAPSSLRLRVRHGLPEALIDDADGVLATEDWLLRRFADRLEGRRRGSGRSGELRVYEPGPEVVWRSAVRLVGEEVEVRLSAGLPAQGRRVLGREAAGLLFQDLPHAAEALAPGPGLEAHVRSVRAQRAMRRQLVERRLVAFVADGAVLPRASGVSQAPLPDAVPFSSPPSLRVTLESPEGPVTGMGVGEGVTLIVGGGFHGKSTLLRALERGHLDHIPGDGRERVVTRPDAVKIRAEDGRRVERVDISGFLGALPGGRSTAPLSTDDASGSTSQAAAVVEAVEAGAGVLLMDEDTCATNLMVRDERIRALVPRSREPITPLVERVRQVVGEWGVSLVVVVGGVGDWLAVADRVVSMEDHRAVDRSDEARALGITVPDPPGPLPRPAPRVPSAGCLDPGRRIRARDERRMQYGDEELELGGVEQVLDVAQARTIGEALRVLHESLVDGRRTLPAALDGLDALLDAEGVDALSPREHPVGGLVRPRRFEVAAAVNRLRSLVVR